MSPAFGTETVIHVHHWTDAYFSFITTRDTGFRFENGQFVMIGLETETRPLLRAYSIASANWEEQLEFLSIKVKNGLLTSRLQHIKPGDKILVGKKPTGTLLIHDLHPGRHLYLLGTGTGLAPWLSIIKDPETYERFDKVILTHGVRYSKDLAYRDYFEKELPQHELLGETISKKLLYYPAVTREDFPNRGRLTHLIESGAMQKTLGLPIIDPANDRFMLCGNPQMLADLRTLLNARSFNASVRIGSPGDYVFERAFVDQ
ncbi:ferredoxin--NADP reductase [Xylella fastidiosa subsp. fastidiosa]|jgi:ferredoxin--NADP+ reductase|uniref:ferredoxin--NADP(+) reductase n=2 Tax=Xylella fastidiosa TaxID=2371 RepID=Q87CY7_XYLFT|nr:ferredoxin--NADP reductase [Xylella fastidiosa]ADN63926.1 ferredoxin-NADP reductase [Xylella fastidiosa subsp. fastidiosa GB514]KAF0571208.1 ferredoxin--NADP reductase [Xylella fastidiosa subsp. fastidiosa Mus-1]AAO28767.1 ferredoxin-NADP reductase [Xylella fastidiosa Temecula1]ACB92389.1 oxidoreductase FAD/NAD(P)-binding domain protein [Xylella fastidiosa M23]EGO81874.1 Flavodoxin reductase-NADPH reductase [Xylella fastidiosa EB92.1]